MFQIVMLTGMYFVTVAGSMVMYGVTSLTRSQTTLRTPVQQHLFYVNHGASISLQCECKLLLTQLFKLLPRVTNMGEKLLNILYQARYVVLKGKKVKTPK